MLDDWQSRQRRYKGKLRSEIILFAAVALIVGFLFSKWADFQIKSSVSYRHSLAPPHSAPIPAEDEFSDILQKQTVNTDWDSFSRPKRTNPEPATEMGQETPAGVPRRLVASPLTPATSPETPAPFSVRRDLPPPVSTEPAGAPSRPLAFPLMPAASAMPSLFSGQAAADSYAWVELLLPALMESTMPLVMDTAMHRLTSTMDAAGEHSLARRFTEEEFNRFVIDYVNRESRGQLRSMHVLLRPEGFLFQAQAFLGKDRFPVSGLIRFSLAGATPKLSIKELTIASHTVSDKTCAQLEKLVNQKITQKNYPLQVKEFQMKDGSAWISVETV